MFLGVNVGGLTCHHGSPFIAVLLHMKRGFHVQIQLCRLAQNSEGMCWSSFYWMHKFRKSKHWPTALTTQENSQKARYQMYMCALSQSHSSMPGWYLCQCGPLRWNYCHSWQDDSLEVIKEVLIQKHLAGLWAPDRFCSHPNLSNHRQHLSGPQISLVSWYCEFQWACFLCRTKYCFCWHNLD